VPHGLAYLRTPCWLLGRKERKVQGWMYILECADGTYYTGSTNDLERRVREHQELAGAMYTRRNHPCKLVYSEEFDKVEFAFKREKQVQRWSHAKKKALIEGKLASLVRLSRKDFSKRHP
jgi:putative endonuclease